MPISKDSNHEVKVLILAKDHVRQLEELRDMRRVGNPKVSLSDVAREVVAAGIPVVRHAVLSTMAASTETKAA